MQELKEEPIENMTTKEMMKQILGSLLRTEMLLFDVKDILVFTRETNLLDIAEQLDYIAKGVTAND